HVVIGDWVEDGQKLLFCRRDGASARTDLREQLIKLKQRIGEQDIRGGLYYSCLGRGRYLFGEESQELKLIHEVLGEFPLCGFFANGEIANNQLYGYTGVLTLFL
ncbi:MAG TPA: histidine kinase, partial [Gammaproteobacteria bacterium]|nr:histidine kinase [Gammaproteobacteria bacterium]